MRSLAVLLGTCILAACGTGAGARSDAPARSPATDPAGAFLLTAAATDFHTHRPPDPVGFREVRLGRAPTPGGAVQYRLCGQFLPAQGGDTAEWTPFVTIKTSDYEQWIGAQAASVYCQGPGITWDPVGDLSPSLQRRLDSLRSGTQPRGDTFPE